MENLIKQQPLDPFTDRTAISRIWSNQIRWWLLSVTSCLMDALRRKVLKHTQLTITPCGTIRLRLLKMAATIRVTMRWV